MTPADNEVALIKKINNGQAFFFAGSGISYMSFMPSAGKVLCKTADSFLPQEAEYKSAREMIILDENNYRIQPELLYETLLYLFKSIDTLLLWKSLSPDYLKTYGYPIVPNINHLFIVDYSVKNNVPIFTTNFDCLFEEAAKELGYDYEVVLPYTNNETESMQSFQSGHAKKGRAYIFKLHGSISLNGKDALDALCTTMTSISKANFPVIDFLQTMCRNKHIIFVGYSGRDIDYFPEIKKRSLHHNPFWIDQFRDPATKENCEYIKAIPITLYPNEVFEKQRPDLNRPVPVVDVVLAETVFDSLQNELKKRVILSEDDKRLLLAQLIREVGGYQLAYSLLLSLYRNNALSTEKQVILLLTLSSLAHENSRYESCGFFAKEALRIAQRNHYLGSYAIRALFQVSESKRMLIAHDTSFSYNINYLDALLAFLSFLKNAAVTRRRMKKLKATKDKSIADIFTIHDSIEHRIRLFALLQAFIKQVLDKEDSIFRKRLRSWLINRWQEIRRECFLEGYSHGIANTYKFETRINRNIDDLKEGNHIYNLTTYETGKGLALRNVAEDLFQHGDYTNAKKSFLEFFETGLRSGNKLNAIKGLLGVAKCNKALLIKPLLGSDHLRTLKSLMSNVEGKNWQRYFSVALSEIEH